MTPDPKTPDPNPHAKDPIDVTPHPETSPSRQRVPGDESSKRRSGTQRDARTGQDQDGNAEQAGHARDPH